MGRVEAKPIITKEDLIKALRRAGPEILPPVPEKNGNGPFSVTPCGTPINPGISKKFGNCWISGFDKTRFPDGMGHFFEGRPRK